MPASLLLFDLDNFKALNDTHGHSLGDIVLKRFSDLARCHLRRGTIFARLGGEEFAALLPQTDLAQAEAQAWTVVRSFARDCVVLDGRTVGATVSVGACMAHTGGSRIEEMIDAADAALYTAKRHGRNQVRAAAPMDRSVPATRPFHLGGAGALSGLNA